MLTNFSWLVPGVIAGMARPGRRGDRRSMGRALDELGGEGIGAVVSLTEDSLAEEVLQERGIWYLHIPMPDMSAPSTEQIDRFGRFVAAAQGESRPVAVHCTAGLGRTGTMLAAFLVSQGVQAGEALAEVRRLRPGSVETLQQEAAVYAYAAQVQGHGRLDPYACASGG